MNWVTLSGHTAPPCPTAAAKQRSHQTGVSELKLSVDLEILGPSIKKKTI